MSKIYPLPNVVSEPLLSPHELKEMLPISREEEDFVQRSRETIQNILLGKDPRLLVISGPCSIHDITAAKEFAEKFKTLAHLVKEEIFLVMRAYFEKPRTSTGWQGLLHDPLLDSTCEIQTGMTWSRQLLIELAKMSVPVASEILSPLTSPYFDDLISWGCIGARTASSQPHRQIASALPFPVGFKNNTDGNIQIAVDGITLASKPQSFIGIDQSGQVAKLRSHGNPSCHLVLRGGIEGPNYHPEDIRGAQHLLQRRGLLPGILIDCSHDNSGRIPKKQTEVWHHVINQENRAVRGLILESHLFSGNQRLGQDPSQLSYGVSITDPCLDFSSTERMIRWAAVKLRKKSADTICTPSTVTQ